MILFSAHRILHIKTNTMLIKLIAAFTLLLAFQTMGFTQVKPKAKRETLVKGIPGVGEKELSLYTTDTLNKAPKTRDNDYVTLCFRNETNRFVDIWDGNVYYGRLSPNGWAVTPVCFYINNKYFYRDWTAQTTEKDYHWNFTRYNYNDDILVISW